ncbi:hypothetical protein R1sor_008413 [Riccia sorocarpa]|uniref:Uncharacterized protein n=1 Tax=Riccia sorocarpa TaxID=122646 RepID=A0ABD3HW60_9MARC
MEAKEVPTPDLPRAKMLKRSNVLQWPITDTPNIVTKSPSATESDNNNVGNEADDKERENVDLELRQPVAADPEFEEILRHRPRLSRVIVLPPVPEVHPNVVPSVPESSENSDVDDDGSHSPVKRVRLEFGDSSHAAEHRALPQRHRNPPQRFVPK